MNPFDDDFHNYGHDVDEKKDDILFTVFDKQCSLITSGMMMMMNIDSLLPVVMGRSLRLDLIQGQFNRWSIKWIWSFIVLQVSISFSLLSHSCAFHIHIERSLIAGGKWLCSNQIDGRISDQVSEDLSSWSHRSSYSIGYSQPQRSLHSSVHCNDANALLPTQTATRSSEDDVHLSRRN